MSPSKQLGKRHSGDSAANRRVSVRFPASPMTVSHMRLPHKTVFKRVRLFNISQGGVGILVRKPWPLNTEVDFQTKNELLNFTFDLPAQVVHATRYTRGRWIVGFAFERQLSLAELASLV